jgi:14-3-3 protein epsilon
MLLILPKEILPISPSKNETYYLSLSRM